MPLDLEEQEQVAELKAWWKEHGSRIVALIVAVAIGYAGLQGWRLYQQNQAAHAAGLYETLTRAVQTNDAKAVRDASGSLVESYSGTLYAAMGALVAARYWVDHGDPKNARAQLQWTIEHASSDDFKDLARLRLAAVLLDEKSYDDALKLVDAKPAPAYEAAYAAMRGDILVAKNQAADAKSAYKLALEKSQGKDSRFEASVKMRLEGLGG